MILARFCPVASPSLPSVLHILFKIDASRSSLMDSAPIPTRNALPYFSLLPGTPAQKVPVCTEVSSRLIQYDIDSKVQHSSPMFSERYQDQTHTARNSLEIPDMRHRSCQLDVSHTLTTDEPLLPQHRIGRRQRLYSESFCTFHSGTPSPCSVRRFSHRKDRLSPVSGSVVDCFRLCNLTFDHSLIFSGDASPILIASNVIGCIRCSLFLA